MAEIDIASRVEPHLDALGERLSPRQFVGVVLVRTDKHDRLPVAEQHVHRLADDVLDILSRRGRECDADNLLQLVDGAGGAGSASDYATVGARIH